MRLDLPDGSPVTLCDVPDVRAAATWGDGAILYSVLTTGIYRVPLSGGKPVLEVAPDRAKAEVSAGWPAFLPDGRRYLYIVRTRRRRGERQAGGAGKPPRDIMTALSTVQYLDPGVVVFARDGTLLGQKVDPQSLAVAGEPFPIAEPVRYFLSTGAASFTASRDRCSRLPATSAEGSNRLAGSRGQGKWIDRRFERRDGARPDFAGRDSRRVRSHPAADGHLRSMDVRHRCVRWSRA